LLLSDGVGRRFDVQHTSESGSCTQLARVVAAELSAWNKRWAASNEVAVSRSSLSLIRRPDRFDAPAVDAEVLAADARELRA
jgi:hypothetical protein